MNKLVTSMTTIAAIMLTAGCATVSAPRVATTDNEPMLVGRPINERISRSSQEINQQIELLDRVSTRKYAGKYEMVDHNNNLDARVGSSRTIPEAYANINKPAPAVQPVESKVSENRVADKGDNKGRDSKVTETRVETKTTVETKTETKTELENKIVKKIDWKNNSTNELGKNLARAMNYDFVLKTGAISDRNIEFFVSEEPLHAVLNKFKNTVAGFAEVVIVKENKTFNLIYK